MPRRAIITSPDQHEDYLLMMQYIRLREVPLSDGGQLLGRKAAADAMGLTISQINGYISKWTRQGLLAMCRKMMAYPLVDEYMMAQKRVLEEFPAILETQIRTAKNYKSPHASLLAAQWLHTAFVEPAILATQDVDDDAVGYIESVSSAFEAFNPLALPEVDSYVAEDTFDFTE